MKVIPMLKRFIQEHDKQMAWFAWIYTHLFGRNRIHGRMRNRILVKNSFLYHNKIIIRGRNNTVYLRNHCVLRNCRITIHGNGNTVILDEKVAALNLDICIEDNGNRVYIGKNTHISGKTHLACIEGCKITIGADCLFSSYVIFRTGDSHSILDYEGNRINQSEDITIGNHVWIGNRTILTKGVRIADHSIVATGAVVTKVFDETNIIIGGIPAKVIKREINWKEQRI